MLCNLTKLETRRLRENFIGVFEIVKGFYDLDPSMFFFILVKHIPEVTI